MMLRLLVVIALATAVRCLDNGLARTPPMGWMSWERFGCKVDCKNDPDNCISEKLYMQMADIFVSEGYKDAGYQYVNIDDCWALHQRDPKTFKLVADPDRFPSGMKALADYIHGKGLKIGTYGDMGFITCGGYPGSKFTMELDAQTFAEWGIDSFKMDGCASEVQDFTIAYPIMEFYLNKTGRPILFSCSWPAYMTYQKGMKVDYPRIAQYCNLWRNYGDISASWGAVKAIIATYGNNDQDFASVQGPGAWNDPDMIVIGSGGLSHNQQRVQMAMWSMFSSPLYLAADLRNIDPGAKAIIQNKNVIAINQDPKGIMAKRVYIPDADVSGKKLKGQVTVWTKPLAQAGSFAMAVLNFDDIFHGATVTFSLKDIGMGSITTPMQMTEVFENKAQGVVAPGGNVTVYVDVSSVFLAKFTPASHHIH